MKKSLFTLAFIALFIIQGQAQDTVRNIEGGGYLFTVLKNLEATPVENQFISSTCWSFSSLSFFESEMERMGKNPVNLSEMFVVWHTYSDKAKKTVRMQGQLNFGPGGAFHDVIYVMKNYGIVPEQVYSGLQYGTEKHIHNEMDAVLKAMVDAIVGNPNKKLTTAWHPAIDNVLNAYLGELPEEFEYNGKKYTPETYLEETGINPDDYIAITSFTHHPFYEQFILEVPDNWLWGSFYNVPLDEMMEIINRGIENGYSVAWAADVSEKGFSFRDRLAIVPADPENIVVKGRDTEGFRDAGAKKSGSAFSRPVEELNVTQEIRQKAFDNQETTDDHGMHITGMAKDQFGTVYYIVKNSWGTKYNDGYFFASEAYVRYKTLNILIHKDAIPKKLKKKLGIK